MSESGKEPGTFAAHRSQAPLVLGLTVGVLLVAPLLPFDAFRAVLTLPIALFAPGLAMRAAFTRRFTRPDVPRLAEAAVVSLATLGLIVIAFYFMRIAIAPMAVAVALAAVIAVAGALAIGRCAAASGAPAAAPAPAPIVWPAPVVVRVPQPAAVPSAVPAVARAPQPQTVARAMRSTAESNRPVAVRPMHTFARSRHHIDRAELQALRERVRHQRR